MSDPVPSLQADGDDGGEAPSVEVVVKLVPEASRADSAEERSVRAVLEELHTPLEPLHPSATGTDLATYFVAHVRPDELDGALERLNRCDGVDGAYAKPQGEPPTRSVERAG